MHNEYSNNNATTPARISPISAEHPPTTFTDLCAKPSGLSVSKPRELLPLPQDMANGLKHSKIQGTMRGKLIDLMNDYRLRNIDMVELLQPLIRDATHITRIKSGENPIKIELALAICHVFDISIEDFALNKQPAIRVSLDISAEIDEVVKRLQKLKEMLKLLN